MGACDRSMLLPRCEEKPFSIVGAVSKAAHRTHSSRAQDHEAPQELVQQIIIMLLCSPLHAEQLFGPRNHSLVSILLFRKLCDPPWTFSREYSAHTLHLRDVDEARLVRFEESRKVGRRLARRAAGASISVAGRGIAAECRWNERGDRTRPIPCITFALPSRAAVRSEFDGRAASARRTHGKLSKALAVRRTTAVTFRDVAQLGGRAGRRNRAEA